MTIDKTTSRRIVGIVAISLLLAWGIGHIDGAPKIFQYIVNVTLPVLVGGLMAFILNLPMRAIERSLFGKPWKSDKEKYRKRLARPISILLTLIITGAIIALIIFLVVPDIVKTVVSFFQSLPGAVQGINNWFIKFSNENPQIANYLQASSFNINNLLNQFINWLYSASSQLASTLLGLISGTVTGVINFFIAVIFAIYFLARKEALFREFKAVGYSLLPEVYMDKLLQFTSLCSLIFSKFFAGQGIESLIFGTLTFFGLIIFRFPFPITISVLQMLGAFIPIVGAFISAIIGGILIWVETSIIDALLFALMIIIIQQIEGNVIYPRVMGSQIGLPSFWVLVAVTCGTQLFGLVGTILAVPTTTIIYVLIQAWSNRRIMEKKVDPHKVMSFDKSLEIEDGEVSTRKTAAKIVEPVRPKVKLSVNRVDTASMGNETDSSEKVDFDSQYYELTRNQAPEISEMDVSKKLKREAWKHPFMSKRQLLELIMNSEDEDHVEKADSDNSDFE